MKTLFAITVLLFSVSLTQAALPQSTLPEKEVKKQHYCDCALTGVCTCYQGDCKCEACKPKPVAPRYTNWEWNGSQYQRYDWTLKQWEYYPVQQSYQYIPAPVYYPVRPYQSYGNFGGYGGYSSGGC